MFADTAVMETGLGCTGAGGVPSARPLPPRVRRRAVFSAWHSVDAGSDAAPPLLGQAQAQPGAQVRRLALPRRRAALNHGAAPVRKGLLRHTSP